MKHQPFSEHTLCLLNAAIEFVEQREGHRVDSWRLAEILESDEQKMLAIARQRRHNGGNEDRWGSEPHQPLTSDLSGCSGQGQKLIPNSISVHPSPSIE
jgi:hypothetical protein